jgi:selenocysteine lyase/cysteine desulfurase
MTVTTAASDVETSAPLPVLGRDVRVPLVTGGEVAYAALDYAASAPALQRVWDDICAYAPYYGSVHRGAGYLSQLSTDLFEQSRDTVARFLGCRVEGGAGAAGRGEGDQVVFTRSTTDSLNLLAAALPAGTQVFVFETEHHASLLPWRRAQDATVTCLAAPRTPEQAVAALDVALHGAAKGPKLVCVTGASNVTGEVWPVRQLAAAAHRHGARIVLDAAQLAPHRRVDVAALDVDWVALSGHKLYAPFGSGVLAGRADWLRDAEPYLAGGGATRRVSRGTDGQLDVEWHTTAARHEAGSPNVIGAYAIASACRALEEAGLDRLAEREQVLLDRLRAGLAEIPEVRVLSLFGDDAPRVGVLSFVVQGWNSSHFAAALSAEHGIGVRDGLFCAHPLVRVLLDAEPGQAGECGAFDAAPGERSPHAIRVSFGVGTPQEHLDRFLAAVGTLVRDGAAWRYHAENGRCVPLRG